MRFSMWAAFRGSCKNTQMKISIIIIIIIMNVIVVTNIVQQGSEILRSKKPVRSVGGVTILLYAR